MHQAKKPKPEAALLEMQERNTAELIRLLLVAADGSDITETFKKKNTKKIG